MAKLTKAEIIQMVSDQTGFTKNQSIEVVETLLELLKKTMASGEDVLVSGFGKFVIQEKESRRGRNPATGEDLMLEPRRRVTFRWSGKLRDKINQNSGRGDRSN
jgi:integration host factor subunit alpha